jgi:hypothetical protein
MCDALECAGVVGPKKGVHFNVHDLTLLSVPLTLPAAGGRMRPETERIQKLCVQPMGLQPPPRPTPFFSILIVKIKPTTALFLHPWCSRLLGSLYIARLRSDLSSAPLSFVSLARFVPLFAKCAALGNGAKASFLVLVCRQIRGLLCQKNL